MIIPSLFQLISLVSKCYSTLFSSFSSLTFSLSLSVSSFSIRVSNTFYISIAVIITNYIFYVKLYWNVLTWCTHRPTALVSNFNLFTILSKYISGYTFLLSAKCWYLRYCLDVSQLTSHNQYICKYCQLYLQNISIVWVHIFISLFQAMIISYLECCSCSLCCLCFCTCLSVFHLVHISETNRVKL